MRNGEEKRELANFLQIAGRTAALSFASATSVAEDDGDEAQLRHVEYCLGVLHGLEKVASRFRIPFEISDLIEEVAPTMFEETNDVEA